MRPPKILLVGEFFSENLGDPLLCRTVEGILRDRWPKAEILPFDLSGKTGSDTWSLYRRDPMEERLTKTLCDRFLYYRRAASLRAYDGDKERHLRVWYALKELKKTHSFDLVIFAGGSLFMDYFAGAIYLIVKSFAHSNTKILFHACGMSSLTADGEYLLRRALTDRHVVSISLRDSYDRFTALFPVQEKTVETYDTALNCSLNYAPASKKRAEYGVGLIDRCPELQLPLLRDFLRSGKDWKAFTNGSPYDQAYGEKLLLEAGVPEDELQNYLIPRPETVEELIETVTGFQKLVSFRMHSQIVAASFGIPSFGFGWDGKIRAFYEKLGFPQGCAGEAKPLHEIEQVLAQYGEDIHPRALWQGAESRDCLINAAEAALGRRGSK